ncbi:BatA domain-containing protein [Salinirubellus salinus]|uniref:BatA domain-containing protein n=1 Tax=Salinirubellus salinus TaxID=1364945 RepID=A0A9E7U8G0_9EURY|nr:BatA domain-containing protein [Salinirubellus salinus]UWM54766.1 BatA domain-containing protein [Salinirubellus salinus]
MAGLSDVFLSPLGLVALLAVVPLVLLYLVRPDPTRLRLPTLEFLTASEETATDRPALSRLRRNLLLLLQALVLVSVALALASPYVTVLGSTQVEETVVVLDDSASMTVTDANGRSRFVAARAAAREARAQTTSLVTTSPAPQVRVQRAGEDDYIAALDDVTVTDAAGDLAGAVSQAIAVADEDARILVVSDFAGDDAWRNAVETARGRGYTVDVRQVGGSVDNVGIVDATYGRTDVTVSVKSYADSEVQRTVALGDQRERLTLRPGDVASVTFGVPAGDAEVRLSPGDDFPTDDRLHLAGPDRARIRVLLVTNGESRFLRTALEVLDEVELTVARPPTSVSEEYDVVVFSEVDGDRLLRSTTERATDLVRDGGGAIVVAQDDLAEVQYGSLLAVDPTGSEQNPTLRVQEDDLTAGIRFPPPDAYLTAEPPEGTRTLVQADGSPLLARGTLGEGRLLYYGYLPTASEFQFNYQYPVLWKRMVYEAGGRQPLRATNLQTGTRVAVGNDTRVVGPDDGQETVSGRVALDAAGHYRVGGQRLAASLVSEPESNVSAPALSTGPDGVVQPREEQVPRPLDLSPALALGALAFVFGEVALLRYRGDL